MYCQVKVNNGSVVIYYGIGGVMRFPTLVKISKLKDKKHKFKDWDYKRSLVNSEIENSAQMNKAIQDWLTKANDIVSQNLLEGIKIKADDLNKELENIRNGKISVKTGIVLDHFREYMEKKREQLVTRDYKADISFITYGTFLSTLNDYEAEYNTTLKISSITDNDWLDNFHTWLTKKRPKETIINGEIYKFKTKGNLKPASVDKRFEVLTGFFAFLKIKGFIKDDSFLRSYKKTEIIVPKKVKTTLSIDEIHKLYKYKFNEEAKEKVKLLFLFSCLTGFRWIDIEQFDKSFISDFKGKKVYKHIASKTKNKSGKIATIPLCKLAIDILEKLDFKLDIFSNAYTNILLHDLLLESQMFNDKTLSVNHETGKPERRYEILSMHRGRDTFISNLINTVPLHELMSYTSHEKLSTLQGYIDYSRDINPEFVAIFDKV